MTRVSLISPEDLIHDVLSRMDDRHLEWQGSNRDWTRQLKLALKHILEGKGINVSDVLYSDTEQDNHEFLLDVLVWSREDGDGVVLAAESEWNQTVGEIVEDFRKLLVVKSPIKVMVYALNKNARVHTAESVWQGIANCLLGYRDHIIGERYVFIDFAPVPFRAAWWIEIPANGRLEELPERNFAQIGKP